MPIHAVLTGDIVNSTKLLPATEKELVKELGKVLRPYKFEFYRGDSFQVYMKEPVRAMQVALLCRTAAISMTAGQNDTSLSDVRISIGIGSVKAPVKLLSTSKGDAFLMSGRSFDEFQGTDRRILMVTGKAMPDIALQVIADYTDAVYRRMTSKQAETIYRLLKGETQQEIAQGLDKSKSTVSQLVSTGGWSEIERLLGQFENLIKLLV
jgi:hypothetical protein